MKIHRIKIENFRGIQGPLDIHFTSPHSSEPRQLTCLLGDNGSGKTSVLQAVALLLSLATRKIAKAEDFRWPGFRLERMASLGPTKISISLEMGDDEIKMVHRLHELYHRSRGRVSPEKPLVPPGSNNKIDLNYQNGRLYCDQGIDALRQFQGRFFANRLVMVRPDVREDLPRVGSVFWFDQQRSLASAIGPKNGRLGIVLPSSRSWSSGVESLREYLIGMWGYHTSGQRRARKDYIPEIEGYYNKVFPGSKFVGIEPMPDTTEPLPQDFYFFIERDGRKYDIAEMSSGEQAIFPLIYEFVRQDIARSIVLIDELELHLHPTGQQALLGMLRRVGTDSQFLISTHSPFLEQIIPDDHEVRLEGGRRCL